MSIDQRSSVAASTSTATSFDRGMEVSASIGQGRRDVIDSLADIPPAWGSDHQPGGCEHELDIHINAALNIGLSAEELVGAGERSR
jgi:hypothetical protein